MIRRATHPFIICFAGWADPALPSSQKLRGCHPFLERLLDTCLLKERLGISPAAYGLSERMGIRIGPSDERSDYRPEARLQAMVAPLAAGLRLAYPRATALDSRLETRVANAIMDAEYFYAATDPAEAARGSRENAFASMDRHEARHLISLLYPELMPYGMDAMNVSRVAWPHPSGDGRSSTASYLELIEEGTAEAGRAIGLVLDFWEGKLTAASLAQGLGEG